MADYGTVGSEDGSVAPHAPLIEGEARGSGVEGEDGNAAPAAAEEGRGPGAGGPDACAQSAGAAASFWAPPCPKYIALTLSVSALAFLLWNLAEPSQITREGDEAVSLEVPLISHDDNGSAHSGAPQNRSRIRGSHDRGGAVGAEEDQVAKKVLKVGIWKVAQEGGWKKLSGVSCSTGNGSGRFPDGGTGDSNGSSLDLDECLLRCQADEFCDGVVVAAGGLGGSCSLRAQLVVPSCPKDSASDTWLYGLRHLAVRTPWGQER